MKKNKIVPGLMAILVMTALLAGCDGGNKTPTPTRTATATATPTAAPTPTATATPMPVSGDTLSEILGLAQNVVTMKYTMVVTMPGLSAMTTETWVKKNKMRIETSMQGIATVGLFDFDAKIMYMYTPSQNMAMKVSGDQPGMQWSGSSIAGYNPKDLGTESIDGIVCQVFEYNDADGNMTKMWIWKDRGLPVKTEVTTTEGKIITEYKNYDFSDIPDSMFELPSGVQIIQTGQ